MLINYSHSGMRDTEKFLSKAQFLKEESEYNIKTEMVPIIKSYDNKFNIIRIEDLLEYSLNNGIDNFGYTLECVCENNRIDSSNVVLSVNENNLKDSEILSTINAIRNAKFSVVVVPSIY